MSIWKDLEGSEIFIENQYLTPKFRTISNRTKVKAL